MATADLPTAVAQILQACQPGQRSWEKKHPCFFIVGAGVSHPSVPLAAKIITQCREEVKGYLDRLFK